MRIFSNRHRPVHLGAYPLETLRRRTVQPLATHLPAMQALRFEHSDPHHASHAMARFMAMFDLIREGAVNPQIAEVPDDLAERARHLKAAGYYFDASMMAVTELPACAHLPEPIRNPAVAALAQELERTQVNSFATGIDAILADVQSSAKALHGPVTHHSHALVILVTFGREPRPNEPGCQDLAQAQAHRAALLANQTAVMLSSYIRMLGFEARAHSATCSELDLGQLALAAGLVDAGGLNPFVADRFALAAVSTTWAVAPDQPLVDQPLAGSASLFGPSAPPDPYAERDYASGAHPFESLTRQAEPTTFIDHERVPRFPKRADFFARALFGDLGDEVQARAKNGHFIMKSPIGACARRALGALLLLQFGGPRSPAPTPAPSAGENAQRVKALAYFLGVDAVGLCAVPDWAYYSHDAGGQVIAPYHPNAINLLIDQGRETMEGASGDDWISVAQSMRAYLRFSLLGGVVAEQIRRLGYSARVHSVLDGDVLQPPLLLLSGLGEVSRIGEVILNPFLGPRLKSGTVTTDMPLQADQPIDFGLQRFCESCNKCARECPSGAITAGPKRMVNGYEIWKSDAEKCTRYRITNAAGGMCGRCMKTCPWNLEGLLADAVWRTVATKLPQSAKALAWLDDRLGRGDINPVKKWWWDMDLNPQTGRYERAAQTNRRGLQTSLRLRPEDQSLAVYPADTLPPPFPVKFPVDREAGIARYQALLSPAEYRARLRAGQLEDLAPGPRPLPDPPPVFPVLLQRRQDMAPSVAKYEFVAPEGQSLPRFAAGAHIDVVIAPEYPRAYSLAGDPADASRYVLGVQREAPGQVGRGGSALMHQSFREGRRVFISAPRNHFPLHEDAAHSWLLAGGIGITPLLAMAHRLHTLGRSFELHYSVKSRRTAGFLEDLGAVPWRDRVHIYASDESQRVDLAQILALTKQSPVNIHLYTCGSARFMDAVFAAAKAQAWPEDALHREYFSVPESPARENHAFELLLTRSGKRLPVLAHESASQVLLQAGVSIDVKCSDGLCGVCACPYLPDQSDPIDHRDFVLSKREREHKLITCCSRTQQPDGVVALAL